MAGRRDETLWRESEILTLHLPLNSSTAGLYNRDVVNQLRPGTLLINTARGGLVDEAALLAALESGHLAGAGLDCQASEPPKGRSLELVRHPLVLALPHSGSKTMAARKRMALVAARDIVALLRGEVPRHVVNKEVLDRLDLKG